MVRRHDFSPFLQNLIFVHRRCYQIFSIQWLSVYFYILQIAAFRALSWRFNSPSIVSETFSRLQVKTWFKKNGRRETTLKLVFSVFGL